MAQSRVLSEPFSEDEKSVVAPFVDSKPLQNLSRDDEEKVLEARLKEIGHKFFGESMIKLVGKERGKVDSQQQNINFIDSNRNLIRIVKKN